MGKNVITPVKCGSDGSMRLHSVVSVYLHTSANSHSVKK